MSGPPCQGECDDKRHVGGTGVCSYWPRPPTSYTVCLQLAATRRLCMLPGWAKQTTEFMTHNCQAPNVTFPHTVPSTSTPDYVRHSRSSSYHLLRPINCQIYITLHYIMPAWCTSWFTVSRQHDAGHPSYDDVTGRQSICRRRTSFLEQPSSCHPLSVAVVVSLRKAAENLFVCLRVAALVTYELAPWKCTD